MFLLENVAKYGLGAKTYNIVKMEYENQISISKSTKSSIVTEENDAKDDAEMEDFEEDSTCSNGKLNDKILKARFEAIVAYVTRHNARGFISLDSFSSVEKNFVGESATSRMAKRQQASLGMFLPGVGPAFVQKKKKKRKAKKNLEGRQKKFKPLAKGKAPVEFEEPIATALSKNDQQISHRVAQEVGSLILARTELPFEASSNLTIISFGKIHKKPGKGVLHSRNYIFPIGFKSEKMFKSFKDPSKRVTYTQELLLPEDGDDVEGDIIYKLTASDAVDEPIFSDSSSTRVWTIVLNKLKMKCKELNLPPSKQAISGPKFFGLSNPKVQLRLEGLEGAENCDQYRFFIQKSYSARLSAQRQSEEESVTNLETSTTDKMADDENTKTNDTPPKDDVIFELDQTKKRTQAKTVGASATLDVTDVPKTLNGPPVEEIPFNSIGNKRIRPLISGASGIIKKKNKLNTTPSRRNSLKASSSIKKKRPLNPEDGDRSAEKKIKKITSFFTKIV
jgi:hypothetical protein